MSKQTKALARFIENLPVEAVIEGTQVTTISLFAGSTNARNINKCMNLASCSSTNDVGCINAEYQCDHTTNGEGCVFVKPQLPTNGSQCVGTNTIACTNMCNSD